LTGRKQMTLDVPLLRSETPGVDNVLHFNNAGAALPPAPVGRQTAAPTLYPQCLWGLVVAAHYGMGTTEGKLRSASKYLPDR
jgi:cysteine desulfurase / selenocysteine lyase